MWLQTLHKGETTTFCCLLRRNNLSFTQTIKLANGPNPAFQHPWVVGHSVLQQSTEAAQPWIFTVLHYRTTVGTRLCFQYTFVTALFILGKLWSMQNCIKYNWGIPGEKKPLNCYLFSCLRHSEFFYLADFPRFVLIKKKRKKTLKSGMKPSEQLPLKRKLTVKFITLGVTHYIVTTPWLVFMVMHDEFVIGYDASGIPWK